MKRIICLMKLLLSSYIPLHLQFWDLRAQVRLYLDEVTGVWSYRRYLRFALWIITAFGTSSLYLVHSPNLSVLARFRLSDPMLFYGLPTQLNWIMVGFAASNMCTHLIAYRPANCVLRLICAVLYADCRFVKSKRREVSGFFAEQYILDRGFRRQPVDVVKRYIDRFVWTISYFVFFQGESNQREKFFYTI